MCLGVVVDCFCQTATITTCVLVEQSAGRHTLGGSIRKLCQRISMHHVSMLHGLYDCANLIVFHAANFRGFSVLV